MDKKQRFTNLMGQLSVNYRKDLTDADLVNFKMMIKRWGMDRFEQALMAHMFDPDEGRFFPNIASIAKHAEGTAKDQQRSIEDRAEMAWSCIEQTIRREGSYGTLKLEDKQALAAVKGIGGWRSLCHCTEDQLVWKRKEFISAYDTYERTPLEQLPSSLPGLIELSEHKQQQAEGMQSLADGVAAFRAKQVKGITQQ